MRHRHRKWDFKPDLDADGKALPERLPLLPAVRPRRHGDPVGYRHAVGDVLAWRAVHLGVGGLDGGGQRLHAVDALGGVGQARPPGADAPAPPLQVGVLGRLRAALGRDGDERLGGGCARGHRGRGLLVGGDA